jgi:small subunit ribosomal protein S24e
LETIPNPKDPNGPVTLRTSKFITNRLLQRKQFVVTITHPTRANLSRDEVAERLAQLYKSDKERVVVFGLRTKFGGGVSTGFGLVYDDEDAQRKFEPRYRLVRNGMAAKVEKPSRKLRKERKNRAKSEWPAARLCAAPAPSLADTLTPRGSRRQEGRRLRRQEVNSCLLRFVFAYSREMYIWPTLVVWLSPGRSAVSRTSRGKFSSVSNSASLGVSGGGAGDGWRRGGVSGGLVSECGGLAAPRRRARYPAADVEGRTAGVVSATDESDGY